MRVLLVGLLWSGLGDIRGFVHPIHRSNACATPAARAWPSAMVPWTMLTTPSHNDVVLICATTIIAAPILIAYLKTKETPTRPLQEIDSPNIVSADDSDCSDQKPETTGSGRGDSEPSHG
jgi:hypothetical protein